MVHALQGAERVKLLSKEMPCVFDASVAVKDEARSLAEDPQRARAEWLAVFRQDLEQFVSREILQEITDTGVHGRPRQLLEHVAFVDVAGGSGADSAVLAIAHAESYENAPAAQGSKGEDDATGDEDEEDDEPMYVEDGQERGAVLDFVDEVRPPFSPPEMVKQFVAVLRRFGCRSVTGDRYAAAWPIEEFRKHGIDYRQSELNRTEIYEEGLPLLNGRRALLLDDPRLRKQLLGLERRMLPSGRAQIDHARGQHDDRANAVVGALTLAVRDLGEEPSID